MTYLFGGGLQLSTFHGGLRQFTTVAWEGLGYKLSASETSRKKLGLLYAELSH